MDYHQYEVSMNEKQTWHDAVRKAGGIVHRDGNIFFTDYIQMEAAVEAMKRIAGDGIADSQVGS